MAVELWLRLDAGSGERLVHLLVTGAPANEALLDALVASALLPPDRRTSLRLARTGRPVADGGRLADLALRHGDLLTIADTEPSPLEGEGGAVECVVASGPTACDRRSLDSEPVTVGRGPGTTWAVADPGLSREHLRLTRTVEGVVVDDLGSTNGTFLFGRRLDGPAAAPFGAPIEAGSSVFVAKRTASRDEPPLVDRAGHAEFNRPPRVTRPPIAQHHRVPAPPEAAVRRRIPLATALAPLVLAPILVALGGGVGFLALMLMSPVIVLASYWEDRRHGGRDAAERDAAFRDRLGATRAEMAAALPLETIARWRAAPDPDEVVRRATGPTLELWERRVGDGDFLQLRIGWTDLPSESTYELGDGGPDELRGLVARTLDPYSTATSVPLILELEGLGAVGVAGPASSVADLARWLVLQLVVHHSPRDLQLALAVSGGEGWDWAPLLPHTLTETGPMVARDRRSTEHLLKELGQVVERRHAARAGRTGTEGASGPRLVIVVDQRLGIATNAVTALLEDGPAVGVHVIWLGEDPASIPGRCHAVVTVAAPMVSVVWTETGRIVEDATVDQIPLHRVGDAGWSLVGLRDAASVDRAREVPRTVDLPTLLGFPEPTADLVAERWSRSRDLGAPIGTGVSGPAWLDLRRDGPHALLGGTTGAGKSETLQTWVASLAAHHPPQRLTFLLVDYKGGAAFKDCVALPHTVGYVTDLDGHLVHRVLTSLHAELSHRERLLAEVGAKDLIEMERSSPHLAPPSLVLVVDEFAALATELPEFVDGVVSLAQRGRSLGIHLILATQRPAGAINDNIRANTNLRISLRMNDRVDSEDVIGSDLAALLSRSLPGRAYVRTGSDELEQIQVGYAGGHAFGRRETASVTVLDGPKGGSADGGVGSTPDEPTDLMRLVEVIGEAHDRSGAPTPRRPWLPELPELLDVADLPFDDGMAVAIGLRDSPSEQAQSPHRIDLSAGSLLVAGAGGAGKTTLMRTLATRLAEQTSPDELHLYVLDFASRGLGTLRALPHCGAVIGGDDLERATRLLSSIDGWASRRRQQMADADVSDIAELRRVEASRGGPVTPRIVVLLDGYAAFAQAFERIEYGRWIDRLPLLVADGRALGVHWVVSAERRLTVSTTLAAAFGERLVLRLNDPDDYAAFNLDRRGADGGADLPPGRGLAEDGDEVQVGILGADPSGEAQIAAVERIGAMLRQRYPGKVAPSIRLLPEEVLETELPAPTQPGHAIVGLDDQELAPVTIVLDDGDLLLAGPPRSGKSTAAATIVRSLRVADPTMRSVLVAPRRSPLVDLPGWEVVLRTTAQIEDGLVALRDEIEVRGGNEAPLLVVVDDAQELADSAADALLEEIVRRGRDVGVHLLVTCDRTAAHRTYGGVVPRIRTGRCGVLLQPDVDADGDLLSATIDRRHGGGPPGRGLLIRAGVATRIQVARQPA